MLKRILLTGALLISVFAVSACGGAGENAPHGAEEAKSMLTSGKYEKKEQSGKTTAEQSIAAADGMNIISYTAENDEKSVAMYYPEFQLKNVDEQLDEYKAAKLNIFNELIRSEDVSKKFVPQLNMTFDANMLAENIYALQFVIDTYISEDKTFSETEIVMVNAGTDSVLTGESLFSDNLNSRDHLYNTLLGSMKSDGGIAPYLNEEKLGRWVFDESNDFSNVRFSDNVLEFTFEQGEIASRAAGSPVVSLQMSELLKAMPESITRLIDGEYIERDEPALKERGKEPEPSAYKVRKLDESTKMAALTFDDGPDNVLTPQVLSLLDRYDAKATFFLLGTKVNLFPAIVEETVKSGHEVGNHTWSHKDLTTISFNEITEEIVRTNEVIGKSSGAKPAVYRAPFGANTEAVDQFVPMTEVDWDIDTEDWLTHDPVQINEMVRNNISDGDIILMHDVHEMTVQSLADMLDYLTDEGYQLVTVSEILHYKEDIRTE
ncbi:Peptidoglycan-N-acetylmuramic acid deacetylase PdaC [Jeotgalicoccus saudimassiliensis]|uniref:Peptidoglycan-N-acetylmuramic acid deacetylase PdaC n=1 Tax=Jeotgalicoccus saudimassiliensis TaxID=1461582 RepID=A0A078LYY3_9STAP|nr:polysaccharide deacetylase family protein [Jeotgalicoccus saudimassiliensis]CDZ99264.1 Peptidoglycan-N-acetylmuramic acid deacetylase PdaC [Jeotgalicoccus saudimassiliensis]